MTGRIDVARALPAAAERASDVDVDAIVSELRAQLGGEGGRPKPHVSLGAALIARLDPHSREHEAAPSCRSEGEHVWRIGADGSWFRAPGGERVDLVRRKPLRLLLDRMAKEHVTNPGRALSWDELM